MDPLKKAIEEAVYFQSLSNDDALALVKELEGWIDRNVLIGKITREEAWDSHFCLLHECDERQFLEDRRRILGKIDTKAYNPFLSSNAGVRFIAHLRARAFGLIRAELN